MHLLILLYLRVHTPECYLAVQIELSYYCLLLCCLLLAFHPRELHTTPLVRAFLVLLLLLLDAAAAASTRRASVFVLLSLLQSACVLLLLLTLLLLCLPVPLYLSPGTLLQALFAVAAVGVAPSSSCFVWSTAIHLLLLQHT